MFVTFAACQHLEEGVAAIIGPTSSSAVKGAYPICEGFNIPQIAPFATDAFLSKSEDDYPFLFKVSINKCPLKIKLHFTTIRYTYTSTMEKIHLLKNTCCI